MPKARKLTVKDLRDLEPWPEEDRIRHAIQSVEAETYKSLKEACDAFDCYCPKACRR